MNRRAFFSKLVAGLLAAPVIAKVIAEPKQLYFNGRTDYLKAGTFYYEGPPVTWSNHTWIYASTDGTMKYSQDDRRTWIDLKPIKP